MLNGMKRNDLEVSKNDPSTQRKTLDRPQILYRFSSLRHVQPGIEPSLSALVARV